MLHLTRARSVALASLLAISLALLVAPPPPRMTSRSWSSAPPPRARPRRSCSARTRPARSRSPLGASQIPPPSSATTSAAGAASAPCWANCPVSRAERRSRRWRWGLRRSRPSGCARRDAGRRTASISRRASGCSAPRWATPSPGAVPSSRISRSSRSAIRTRPSSSHRTAAPGSPGPASKFAASTAATRKSAPRSTPTTRASPCSTSPTRASPSLRWPVTISRSASASTTRASRRIVASTPSPTSRPIAPARPSRSRASCASSSAAAGPSTRRQAARPSASMTWPVANAQRSKLTSPAIWAPSPRPMRSPKRHRPALGAQRSRSVATSTMRPSASRPTARLPSR